MPDRMRRLFCTVLMLAAALLFLMRLSLLHGGADHGIFYYATRAVFSGQNAYDQSLLIREWKRDGSPFTLTMQHMTSTYLYPPNMTVFYAPSLLVPVSQAHRVIALTNGLALMGIVWFLLLLAYPSWRTEYRMLFSAYALLLPPVKQVCYYGQSALLIGLATAGALLALNRKREWLGGGLLAPALAKYTPPAPFASFAPTAALERVCNTHRSGSRLESASLPARGSAHHTPQLPGGNPWRTPQSELGVPSRQRRR